MQLLVHKQQPHPLLSSEWRLQRVAPLHVTLREKADGGHHYDRLDSIQQKGVRLMLEMVLLTSQTTLEGVETTSARA